MGRQQGAAGAVVCKRRVRQPAMLQTCTTRLAGIRWDKFGETMPHLPRQCCCYSMQHRQVQGELVYLLQW